MAPVDSDYMQKNPLFTQSFARSSRRAARMFEFLDVAPAHQRLRHGEENGPRIGALFVRCGGGDGGGNSIEKWHGIAPFVHRNEGRCGMRGACLRIDECWTCDEALARTG
jgi:hypothetical protein